MSSWLLTMLRNCQCTCICRLTCARSLLAASHLGQQGTCAPGLMLDSNGIAGNLMRSGQQIQVAVCRYGLTSIPPAPLPSRATEYIYDDDDDEQFDVDEEGLSPEDDEDAFWAAQEERREQSSRRRVRVRLCSSCVCLDQYEPDVCMRPSQAVLLPPSAPLGCA